MRSHPKLEQDLCQLLDRTRARAIVMVLDDGSVTAWRPGIPAEDLRHELITAANQMRRDVLAKAQTGER